LVWLRKVAMFNAAEPPVPPPGHQVVGSITHAARYRPQNAGQAPGTAKVHHRADGRLGAYVNAIRVQ
jgi:hypothetical protein